MASSPNIFESWRARLFGIPSQATVQAQARQRNEELLRKYGSPELRSATEAAAIRDLGTSFSDRLGQAGEIAAQEAAIRDRYNDVNLRHQQGQVEAVRGPMLQQNTDALVARGDAATRNQLDLLQGKGAIASGLIGQSGRHELDIQAGYGQQVRDIMDHEASLNRAILDQMGQQAGRKDVLDMVSRLLGAGVAFFG